MKIELGTTTSTHNKIKKTFTVGITREFSYKGDDKINFAKPQIILKGNAGDFDKYNYAHITYGEGRGFYYIPTDGVSAGVNGLVTINLIRDDLKTYQSQILKSKCMLDRSDNAYNLYLPDSTADVLGYHSVDCKEMAKPFEGQDENIIIITVGGNQT